MHYKQRPAICPANQVASVSAESGEQAAFGARTGKAAAHLRAHATRRATLCALCVLRATRSQYPTRLPAHNDKSFGGGGGGWAQKNWAHANAAAATRRDFCSCARRRESRAAGARGNQLAAALFLRRRRLQTGIMIPSGFGAAPQPQANGIVMMRRRAGRLKMFRMLPAKAADAARADGVEKQRLCGKTLSCKTNNKRATSFVARKPARETQRRSAALFVCNETRRLLRSPTSGFLLRRQIGPL